MYDHHKKAGNQGDVVKHAALTAVLDTLLPSSSKVFRYAEPFAGFPFNPLTKGAEWTQGIGRLNKATSLNPHVLIWRRFWDHGLPLLGSVYPGSSAIALRLASFHRRSLRSWLWDISPDVVRELQIAYRGLKTSVLHQAATAEEVAKARPNLVLVDPPGTYSKRNPTYPKLDFLLRFFYVAQNVVLWLPRTAKSTSPPTEAKTSIQHRNTALECGLRATVVYWTKSSGFSGCQLFYRLPASAESALRCSVEAVVEETDWPVKQVTHFGGGNGG